MIELTSRLTGIEKKSSFNQKWYKILQIISIISAPTIPFLTRYSSADNNCIRIAIGILGLIFAAITATLSLYKFQEHWFEYRTISELLRHEKNLFLTKTTTPYDNNEAFSCLVERVEAIISKENTDWWLYMNKPKK